MRNSNSLIPQRRETYLRTQLGIANGMVEPSNNARRAFWSDEFWSLR
jgi:hypothetical protein